MLKVKELGSVKKSIISVKGNLFFTNRNLTILDLIRQLKYSSVPVAEIGGFPSNTYGFDDISIFRNVHSLLFE